MSRIERTVRVFALAAVALVFSSCAYYSFSGATLPSRLETIAVPLVEDETATSIPGLSDRFTSDLTDRFVNQTRLSLASSAEDADVVLEGTIQGYTNQPTSVTGEEARLNRVTIRVNVRYYDQVEDSVLLDQTFSSFEEYDPQEGLDGERQAAFAALETLAGDIFTSATSDW